MRSRSIEAKAGGGGETRGGVAGVSVNTVARIFVMLLSCLAYQLLSNKPVCVIYMYVARTRMAADTRSFQRAESGETGGKGG